MFHFQYLEAYTITEQEVAFHGHFTHYSEANLPPSFSVSASFPSSAHSASSSWPCERKKVCTRQSCSTTTWIFSITEQSLLSQLLSSVEQNEFIAKGGLYSNGLTEIFNASFLNSHLLQKGKRASNFSLDFLQSHRRPEAARWLKLRQLTPSWPNYICSVP